MERFLDKQRIELIRMTMLAQEEVFQHQVRELHRLYSVQKMLMDELKKDMKQKGHWWTNQLNLTSQSMVFGYNNNKKNNNVFINQSSRERKGIDLDLDLERPANHQGENSAADHDHQRSFDKMGTNGSDTEESELELTLSIGLSSSSSSKSYQREINRELYSSASFRLDNNNNNQDCSGPGTPINSSNTTLDQEKNRPHRLFQGLRINRS